MDFRYSFCGTKKRFNARIPFKPSEIGNKIYYFKVASDLLGVMSETSDVELLSFIVAFIVNSFVRCRKNVRDEMDKNWLKSSGSIRLL